MKWYQDHKRKIYSRCDLAWKVAILLCLLKIALG